MVEAAADNNLAYRAWIESQRQSSKGERARRLSSHGHAERLFALNVWWPAFGSFAQLEPEYEVTDFKDGYRYLDFVYKLPHCRICIEIDGFGPHCRDIDRWQFADNLLRQNQLLIDEWKMLRFSYDDVKEKPRRCQQMLQQAIGKWGNLIPKPASPSVSLTVFERAVLHAAMCSSEPISPTQLSIELDITRKTAAKHLAALCAKGLMASAKSDTGRAMKYRLVANEQIRY